jgi:ABC-type nitrate/sulfonate/bicarbonate transport system substrate-binding protein
MKQTLTLFSLLLVVFVSIAPAHGATVIRIGTSSTDVAGEPFYADERGTYRKHGLSATVTPGMSGADVIEALDAGTIDIGFANVISVAGAIQKGKSSSCSRRAGCIATTGPS